jgi:hypothetical protein
MRIAASSSQLLLKSFGYGIFLVQIVPSELMGLLQPPSNADTIRILESLVSRIRGSGIPNIQEIIPDPEDPEQAYVLVREGQPPCELEKGQWEPSDLNRLFTMAETAGNTRFSSRVAMLKDGV